MSQLAMKSDHSTFDPDEPLARELYETSCMVMGEVPDWGRAGFKLEVAVWLALAKTARRFIAEQAKEETA